MTAKKKAVSMAAATAAAAAIGFGVSGVAQADTTTPTPTSTSTQSSGDAASSSSRAGHGPGGRHGGGPGRGLDLGSLATTLGVDQTKLQTALTTVREEMKPADGIRPDGIKPDGAAKPDRSVRDNELATKLASKLGIDSAKVKAAFTELRTAAEAHRTKAFDDRLAQAVKDSKLTQAEADAVKKAAKAGVIGMGGDRGQR
ncbi:hypothetical protein BA895_21575 [Humibacillus sp. DSM 29435]|nr:hypothetical protein [Humibacillus sp. DSM 29435]OFE15738.1 hypothetical protein BA895_21575 [Humibacillus sp. DSM 29435]